MAGDSSSGSASAPAMDAVASALRAYYRTRGNVPPPPLATRSQPINDINLSIVAVRQLSHQASHSNRSTKDEEKESLSTDLRGKLLTDYEKQFKLVDQAVKVELLFDQPVISNEKDEEKKYAHIPAPKKLLILGQPGVGKSTMCQYMAYQWGKGNLWQNHFDYVFWIPLRQLRNKSADSDWDLAKIVYEHCICPADDSEKELDEESYIQALRALLKKAGSRILFLLDGYDEVAHLDVEGSFLRKVFKKVFYQSGTIDYRVILTSRPYRLVTEYDFDLRLENKGFTDEQIKTYIADYFKMPEEKISQKSQDLIKLLKSDLNLWSMTHVPLNAALVCGVYQNLASLGKTFNTDMTLTELYQEISEQLLKRYLERPDLLGKNGTVDWLPASINSVCDIELRALEFLAFEGLQGKEPVLLAPDLFKQEYIEKLDAEYTSKKEKEATNIPKPKTLLAALVDIGFLKNVGNPHLDATKNPHEFIHLTFQEFFAAAFVVRCLQQPKDSIEYQRVKQFLREKKYNSFYQVVFQFIAGLLTSAPATVQTDFWQGLLSEPSDLMEVHQAALWVRCLSETRSQDSILQYKELMAYLLQWLRFLLSLELSESRYQPLLQAFSGSKHEIRKLVEDEVLKGLLSSDVRVKRQVIWSLLFKTVSGNDKIVSALITLLQNEVEDVRKAAARALKDCAQAGQSEQIVKLLISLLQNKERPDVREAAVNALGRCAQAGQSEQIVKLLISLLQNKERPDVREAAVNALGRCAQAGQAKEVVKSLFSLLSDEVEGVRKSVAEALGWCALAGQAEKVIEPLFSLLQDKEWRVKEEAASALERCAQASQAEKVTQSLLPLLQNGVCSTTWRIVNTLEVCMQAGQEEKVIKPLLDLLQGKQDQNGYVRMAVARALESYARIGQAEKVVQSLLSLLENKEKHVKKAVIRALKWCARAGQAEKVFNGLFLLLQDQEWEVRGVTVEALAACAEAGLAEEMLEPLLGLLLDEEVNVGLAAANVLGACALAGQAEEIVKRSLNLLQNERWEVRWVAARTLGLCSLAGQAGEVVGSLLSLLQDEKSIVREEVVSALGLCARAGQAEKVVGTLLLLFRDDEQVRWAARNALFECAEAGQAKMMVEPLCSLLEGDEKWGVREDVPSILNACVKAAQAENNDQLVSRILEKILACKKMLKAEILVEMLSYCNLAKQQAVIKKIAIEWHEVLYFFARKRGVALTTLYLPEGNGIIQLGLSDIEKAKLQDSAKKLKAQDGVPLLDQFVNIQSCHQPAHKEENVMPRYSKTNSATSRGTHLFFAGAVGAGLAVAAATCLLKESCKDQITTICPVM